MQLMRGWRAIALGVLVTVLCACNGDDTSASGTNSTQNSPPSISGSPKTSIRAGEQYQFTPQASDPDGQTLHFSIANRPGWLDFDATTGRASGKPATSDVGTFAGVTISVTDGAASTGLAPFTIRVDSTTASPTQPHLPSAGGPFRFAEVPEVVFVRGYRETEHLGIFHLDTRNRWTPGDLDNETGWRPRVATQLEVVAGSVEGVSYDPATGILSYDGSGQGTATARAQLTAPSVNATSQEFSIRVLAPTMVWGPGAAQRFPGIGYDSGSTSWSTMQRRLQSNAAYEAPNVLLLLPGRYSEDFYLKRDLTNLYIIGEPGSRPVLVGDLLNLDNLETGYLKNLDLDNTTVNTAGNLRDRAVNIYVTQVYQHDSTRDDNGFKAPPGSPSAAGSWRYWFWNFHGSQMGWQSNLRHQMYIEGRLDSRLLINNIRITGSNECSSIKSTRSFVSIRNSYLSALLDERDLSVGRRSEKIVDLIGAADIVIYNNSLVGAFSQARRGVSDGLIFLQARRAMWGSDSPVYPDVSFDPPLSSLRAGFAPEGFTSGPETFVDPAFWSVVRSYDIADPANPYSFKKYIAYNRFRWIDEDNRRQSVFRDDGTAPRTAAYLASAEEIWGTVPSNWTERSVSFFANNSYEGWLAADVSEPRRWFDLDNHVVPDLVTRQGPGPWAYPPPARSVVFVGGEQRPDAAADPVELPDWFRI